MSTSGTRAETAEQPCVALLRAAVDALVGLPAERATVAQLTELVAGVSPQLDRLDGRVRAAEGELDVRTGGQLPTDEGAPRSVAGWLADLRRESACAADSRLRTAGLLRQLPLVADAVLEGLLTPAQAQVLTRLVGKVDHEALLESQKSLLLVAAPLDLVDPRDDAARVGRPLRRERRAHHRRRRSHAERQRHGSPSRSPADPIEGCARSEMPRRTRSRRFLRST